MNSQFETITERFDRFETAEIARFNETNRRIDFGFYTLLIAMFTLTGVIVATIKL